MFPKKIMNNEQRRIHLPTHLLLTNNQLKVPNSFLSWNWNYRVIHILFISKIYNLTYFHIPDHLTIDVLHYRHFFDIFY